MDFNRRPVLSSYEQDRDHARKITTNPALYDHQNDSGLYVQLKDFTNPDAPLLIGYGFDLLAQSGQETKEMLEGLTADKRHFRDKEAELIDACREKRPVNIPGHILNGVVPDSMDVLSRLGRVILRDEDAASELLNRQMQKWEDSFDQAIQHRVVPYSRERAAILSAGASLHDGTVEGWKQTMPSIIGWLTLDQQDAIAQRARPEIFCDLRYNIVPEKSRMVAKQRLFESEMFGLFDNPDTVSKAQYGITERVLHHNQNKSKKFYNNFSDKILKSSQNLFVRYTPVLTVTDTCEKLKMAAQNSPNCAQFRRKAPQLSH